MKPFEFLDELFIPKTRVLELSVGEDFVILACVFLTRRHRMTDRQTDGQTDNSIVANTGLYIASYADALLKVIADTTAVYIRVDVRGTARVHVSLVYCPST